MEELKRKKETLLRCLETVEEGLKILQENTIPEHEKALQDSVIKRFEYTIDNFWKFIKLYMTEKEHIELIVSSPKAILKEALTYNLIKDEEFQLLEQALNSRNLTSHIYHEEISLDILEKVPSYHKCMVSLLSRFIL